MDGGEKVIERAVEKIKIIIQTSKIYSLFFIKNLIKKLLKNSIMVYPITTFATTATTTTKTLSPPPLPPQQNSSELCSATELLKPKPDPPSPPQSNHPLLATSLRPSDFLRPPPFGKA